MRVTSHPTQVTLQLVKRLQQQHLHNHNNNIYTITMPYYTLTPHSTMCCYALATSSHSHSTRSRCPLPEANLVSTLSPCKAGTQDTVRHQKSAKHARSRPTKSKNRTHQRQVRIRPRSLQKMVQTITHIMVYMHTRTKHNDMEDTKLCIKCQQRKPLHVFEKKKRELNRRNICETCRKGADRLTRVLKRKHVREHGMPAHFSTCKVCNGAPRTLVFDHCHKTNMFRGWICRNCNAAIGKLGDDYNGLNKALQYLREFETAQTLFAMKFV